MTKNGMKSMDAFSHSSEKKHRRIFSAAVVLLVCCLAFVGTVGAADGEEAELPKALVTVLDSSERTNLEATIPEDSTFDLTYALMFKALDTDDASEELPYDDWYVDFVISFSDGLTVGFPTNTDSYDGFLAGNYGTFGWIPVPQGIGSIPPSLEVEANVQYPIMTMVGMQLKYKDIRTSVKEFGCGVYQNTTSDNYNENLVITLELKMAEESGEDAMINSQTRIFSQRFSPDWEISYLDEFDEDLTYEEGASNPTKYNASMESFTLVNPIKEGYQFSGWLNTTSNVNEGTEVTIDPGTTHIGDLKYKATWTPNTYSVIFDANGGDGEMTQQPFTYDAEQELPENGFTRTGYQFNGWNTKADGSGTSYEDKATVKNLTSVNGGTVTLYANWTAETYTVTVTSTDGGTASASKNTAKYGEEITLTASPNEGYSFFGWVTEGNIELSSDGKFTMPAYGVTVEAVFKEIQTEEEIIPTPSSSSGSEGSYLSFPRTTSNGGLVDFGSSKVVKAVLLPEGSSGSVVLKVDTIEKWPKAVDTEYNFDISVEKPVDGISYIPFEIPLSTLESLELTPADICAYHFVDGEWVKLTTTYEVKDGTVCYESETDSFSPFKLVIEKGSAVPKAEENIPTVPPTEEPEDNPQEILPPIPPAEPTEPESPSPILAVFAGLGAAAVLRRK